MLKQYDLVSNCLSELQRSNLPEKYRWQLEVQLYQLRRLLLQDHIAEMVRDDTASEQNFQDLYREMKHACESASPLTPLDSLVAVASQMKKALYAYCRRETPSKSYNHDGGSRLSHR